MQEMVVSTDGLMDLLEQGKTVELVDMDDEAVKLFEQYSEADKNRLQRHLDGMLVDHIEYEGIEDVQCIALDDADHLYITDDGIVTHNTSDLIFLKSTDDSMIETLQKMSGTTHKAFKDSKTVTKDMEKLFMQNEGKVSYTMSVKEIPVISYNDMAFISERNSIVFRAGDAPIWNRNETILPMSWRLLRDTIKQPGKSYTFQTIPTLSSAKEFDRRKNQPDFGKMVDKRMAQAIAAENAKSAYQSIYDYSDTDIERLDPNLYANEIMEVINTSLQENVEETDEEQADDDYDAYLEQQESMSAQAERNVEQERATAAIQAQQAEADKKRFANKMLSQNDIAPNGVPNHSFDNDIIKAYIEVRGSLEQDRVNFMGKDGSLYSSDGMTPYIIKESMSDNLNTLNDAAKDKDKRVFSEEDVKEEDIKSFGTYTVTDEFLDWLSKQSSWRFARGAFERELGHILSAE